MITGEPSSTFRATTAPLSPPYNFGPPAFPPPVPPTDLPARRRRALPIALGVIAALGIAGTIAGYAGKASSDSRASALTRSNRNLNLDLDDADAEIKDLEDQLDDSSAELESLTTALADSQAELESAQDELDAARQGDDPSDVPMAVPSLNDGVVSSVEADLLASQMPDLGFAHPTLELSAYQDMADRVCAIESVGDLPVVIQRLYAAYPEIGSLPAAAFLAGGAAGASCQTHLADVLDI